MPRLSSFSSRSLTGIGLSVLNPGPAVSSIRDLAQNTTLTPPSGWSINSTVTNLNTNSIQVIGNSSVWDITNSAYGISGPLTYELWFYPLSMPNLVNLGGLKSTTNPYSGFTLVFGSAYANDLGLLNVSNSGGTTLIRLTNFGQTPADVQLNAWNHAAVTYTAINANQQDMNFWLNGAWQGGIETGNYGGRFTVFPQTIRLGASTTDTTTAFNGYYGQIRLSNTLRYTGSGAITVPTAAWNNDANTVSLITAT